MLTIHEVMAFLEEEYGNVAQESGTLATSSVPDRRTKRCGVLLIPDASCTRASFVVRIGGDRLSERMYRRFTVALDACKDDDDMVTLTDDGESTWTEFVSKPKLVKGKNLVRGLKEYAKKADGTILVAALIEASA